MFHPPLAIPLVIAFAIPLSADWIGEGNAGDGAKPSPHAAPHALRCEQEAKGGDIEYGAPRLCQRVWRVRGEIRSASAASTAAATTAAAAATATTATAGRGTAKLLWHCLACFGDRLFGEDTALGPVRRSYTLGHGMTAATMVT